jgi:hypothetical protein
MPRVGFEPKPQCSNGRNSSFFRPRGDCDRPFQHNHDFYRHTVLTHYTYIQSDSKLFVWHRPLRLSDATAGIVCKIFTISQRQYGSTVKEFFFYYS